MLNHKYLFEEDVKQRNRDANDISIQNNDNI